MTSQLTQVLHRMDIKMDFFDGSSSSGFPSTMKLYIAVVCIVLLQGVQVNCQSSLLDSAMNTINSVYQQYRSGTLLRNLMLIAREYINFIVVWLSQLQNYISSFQAPPVISYPQATVPNRAWQHRA